jgi:hypothetical protein
MKPTPSSNDFGLNEYKKVSLCSIPAFIPTSLLNADVEMLNKLKAAVYSLFMGVSLTTAYKHLKGHRIKEQEEFLVAHEAKAHCNHLLFQIKNTLSTTKYTDELNYSLIGNTLVRLESSYEAAIFLSYEGFNFETKAIARMILEQLSYIYQVAKPEHTTADNILDFYNKHNIQNSNISGLKKYFPYIDLGRLYNTLTEHAHFDKKTQWSMFKFDREKDETSIYRKSFRYSYYNFYVIIILLEMTQILIEFSFKDILPTLQYIESDSRALKQDFLKIRYDKADALLEAAVAFEQR